MPLTGRDVWDAIVKLGLMSGPYDPRTNRYCENAEKIAGLLNEVLNRRQSWLPKLIETEDAMRTWEADTPHEYVLRLYKFLNQAGYTVVGIDAAIEREAKKRKGSSPGLPSHEEQAMTNMPQEIALDALDLAAIIRPGDHIVWGQGAGEPSTLVEKLLEQRHRIGHASIFLGGVRSRRTLRPEHGDVLTFSSIGAIGNLRALANAGLLRVIPTHLSQLSGYFAQGLIRADVVFVQLSEPDENGEYSFSIANDFQQAAMARARVVIAEVNDQVPWTYCEGRVDPARIDYIVRTSRPPVQVHGQVIGPVEEAIARHVGRFIEDGTTIQIGVGAIPDAVLASVGDRRDLGIHSGLIGDRAADLMEQGVITNARKPVDTGITTTGSLLGTDRLYRFAHKNRSIRMFTQMHTHRVEILSKLGKMVALNSAIEVDLTGQINAETASGAYLGGVGGQGDFVRGVQMAAGGRSIIALPATALDGAISRIVPRLEDGVVTTVRSDADVIVTEFGAAELRGLPLEERAHRMAAISHPSYREQLTRGH